MLTFLLIYLYFIIIFRGTKRQLLFIDVKHIASMYSQSFQNEVIQLNPETFLMDFTIWAPFQIIVSSTLHFPLNTSVLLPA